MLAEFARGDWQVFEKQFEKGEITLEKCLAEQFSLVGASKGQILERLEPVVAFRPNFKKFAKHCKERGIPLIIVSAGLDFVIEHFLELYGCRDLVEIYSAKTSFKADGIRFTFPKLFDPSSDNFKQDLVRHRKLEDKKIMYIGNGTADCAAAKDANYSFAIKGSSLARLCKTHGIPCENITDFQRVIQAINKIVTPPPTARIYLN